MTRLACEIGPPNKGIAPTDVDRITAAHIIKNKIGPTNVVIALSHVIGGKHEILHTHEEAIEYTLILTQEAVIGVIILAINDEIEIPIIVTIPMC